MHESIYRCSASNQAGIILSRDIYVRGGELNFFVKNFLNISKTFFPLSVVRQKYDIKVETREAFIGNAAYLRCTIPSNVQEFVRVSAWYRGEEVFMPERLDIGKFAHLL